MSTVCDQGSSEPAGLVHAPCESADQDRHGWPAATAISEGDNATDILIRPDALRQDL